jgi:antitoxin component YwqK of YwqJK toxin-antitoxin module
MVAQESTEDLQTLLVNANAMAALLEAENAVMASHAERLTDMKRQENLDEEARPRKKAPPKVDHFLTLPLETKIDIAMRELEETKDAIQNVKEAGVRLVDNHKAEIECYESVHADIKKAQADFTKDIVHSAIDKRTNKVVAEKFLRYLEEKVRAKDALIEKTRLKNVSLRTQKNKLHQQLKQKEEMGEVLHAIDFDQLQIENRQFLQKIEEKNGELAKLKLVCGNTVSKLNNHKKLLGDVLQESRKLKTEINQRADLLNKLEREAERVQTEKETAKEVNSAIRLQLESYKVPQVMDYVEIKVKHADLVKKLKTWERKMDIANAQTLK